jgi:hypothetical protein
MRNTMLVHQTLTTPIDKGMGGYRSECDTCGTVLRVHDTEKEAERHTQSHQSALFVIEQFFIGRTNAMVDNKRNVLVLQIAKEMDYATYTVVLDLILQARREHLTTLTLWQRKWQTNTSRRPARGRHHDSWSIREKYVRCAA